MKLNILELVALAAVLVAVMAAATVVVLKGERRDKRVAGRLSLAVTPYARMTALATMGRRQHVARPLQARLLQRLGGLFGYDPARADQLPWPVPAVLATAGLVGFAACLMLSRLIGSAALLGAPVAWRWPAGSCSAGSRAAGPRGSTRSSPMRWR